VTPPRSHADPAVRPFPVFQVIVAADGTSATFNGQQIPTSGHPDLLTAVHATAGAAATNVGRPVRMDLTTPTGQVRHLIAHPAATPPPAPQPDQAPAPETPTAAAPAPAAVDCTGGNGDVENPDALDGAGTPDGAVAPTTPAADPEPTPDRAPDPAVEPSADPDPDPAVLPLRGDAVTTPPTTPPSGPLNGHRQHRRLTPLDDPLPRHDTAARPADTPPPLSAQPAPKIDAPPAAPIPLRRPTTAEDRWLFGHRDETAPPAPAPPAPASSPPVALSAVVGPHTAQAPPAPVATLQPAGLLPRLRPTAARPTVGWQARVHAWTRGRITPPPSATERRHRELVAAVQAAFTGPRLVAVVNPKGGAGKTPAVLAAAATWGAHRGSVIAWDDNETRGTLGMRALADPREPTIAGLLADLPRLEGVTARVGDLAAHLRPQGDARFDVLASDDDPARMAQFGAGEFTRVRELLARFYAVTVVDTGNNVRAGNWQAAVDAADQLLLVSTYQRDAAVTASWTLDHLHATGRGHLADTAVTVLSAATPATDRRVRAELRGHFTARTRAVVEIPYDPVIADGEHLDLPALRPATRDAWLAAAAALTEGLTG